MEQTIVKSATSAANDLVQLARLGASKLWVDYDKKADVLYVNFGRPQKADDAYQTENGIIQRKRKNKLVGLTILNASQLAKQ